MYFGCSWYPEHFPTARWPEDVRLMRAAGMNVVRVGEFAWSRIEPEEGRFELDWLERAVELAADAGLDVVIGTPTAAPPAWLTQRYPDVLAVREDGQRRTHGNRTHFSFTSPRYCEFCRRIADELARRFGQHTRVIGWQIDNEYNTISYDAETQRQFQGWLQSRYGTLERLNAAWGTTFWSQEYSDWAQIPIPVGVHHPSLALAWRRFISHTYRAYQRAQIDAIRAHAAPRQWFTHNFMTWYDGFDHYELTADLDLAAWDNYVGHLDTLSNGAAHDLVRGFKRKNFWVMEAPPGCACWAGVNNMLDRGEARRFAWHAVGHGADALLYWPWAIAPGGQEQYHGTLVGTNGKPRPFYAEAAEIGREFARAADALRDTTVEAPVAILHSYADRWAINGQRHHKDFDPVGHLYSFYTPLRALGLEIDIVHPSAPLDRYRLVVAPALHLLEPATAARLLDFARGGGHLALGARTGMKDDESVLLPVPQPGALAEGFRVEEFYALDRPAPVAGELGAGTATIWAERLTPAAPDTEALLRYGASNGWLDGHAAALTRRLGAGRLTYLGAWLDAGLMARFAGWLADTSALAPTLPAPPGVEVCRRVWPAGEVFILINTTDAPQTIALPRPLRNLLADDAPARALDLAAGDVAVLA